MRAARLLAGLVRLVLDLAPEATLLLMFITAWIRPKQLEAATIKWLLMVMLLEFIVIHSAAFSLVVLARPDPPWRRGLNMLGLGCFYSLFAGGFALASQSWWPLASFWLLMFNRMGLAIRPGGPDPAMLKQIQQTWGINAMVYVFTVFATTILPIPSLGFTHLSIKSLNLPGSGLWISQPWRVMALGTIYFGFQTTATLRRHWRELKASPSPLECAATASPPSSAP